MSIKIPDTTSVLETGGVNVIAGDKLTDVGKAATADVATEELASVTPEIASHIPTGMNPASVMSGGSLAQVAKSTAIGTAESEVAAHVPGMKNPAAQALLGAATRGPAGALSAIPGVPAPLKGVTGALGAKMLQSVPGASKLPGGIPGMPGGAAGKKVPGVPGGMAGARQNAAVPGAGAPNAPNAAKAAVDPKAAATPALAKSDPDDDGDPFEDESGSTEARAPSTPANTALRTKQLSDLAKIHREADDDSEGDGGGDAGNGPNMLARIRVWTANGAYNNPDGWKIVGYSPDQREKKLGGASNVISVSEGLNECFEAHVTGLSPTPDIKIEDIVGKGMAVQLDFRDRPQLIWAGFCASIEQVSAPASAEAYDDAHAILATYRVTIVPALWRTKMRVNNRIFQHMTIPQIVQQILDEWEIIANVEEKLQCTPYVKHEYRVQWGESDFAFISRLLEEAGITYYFEHNDATSDISIPHATPLKFADTFPSSGAVPLPYLGNQIVHHKEAMKDAVEHASIAVNVVHNRRTIRDYDFLLTAPDNPLYKSDALGYPESPKYEIYQYQPGAFWADGQTDPGEAQKRVNRELDAARAGGKVVTISTARLELSPGQVFKVGLGDKTHDHPLIKPDQTYVATHRTLHGRANDRIAMQHVVGAPNETWRPPHHTRRPTVVGIQSAVVVGPKWDEIHTDPYGRVKVRFHWDRETTEWQWDDESPESSCWMRVSQVWAGGQGEGFGGVMVPRVGEEVLVSFYEGDPDRPVIVGRVYNATASLPYSLPENKTKTVLRTQTWSPTHDQHSPDKGSKLWRGFNELSFEDIEEQEEVFIQAQKNFRTVVKDSESHDIGGGNEKDLPDRWGGAKWDKVEGRRITRIGDPNPSFKDKLNKQPFGEEDISVGKHYILKVGNAGCGIEITPTSILLRTPTASIVLGDNTLAINSKNNICIHAQTKIHMSTVGKKADDSKADGPSQEGGGDAGFGHDIVIENRYGHVHVRAGEAPTAAHPHVQINCTRADEHPVNIQYLPPATKAGPGKEILFPWWPGVLPTQPQPPKGFPEAARGGPPTEASPVAARPQAAKPVSLPVGGSVTVNEDDPPPKK